VTAAIDVGPEPGALFALSGSHREFQEVCRSFVARHLLARVAEVERREEFPPEWWPLMGGAGLLGLGYPDDVGGTGDDALAVALLSEELAHASGGIAITPLVSSYMAAPYLASFGTDDQKDEFLTPVLVGRKIAAIAVTEPGAGSDVAALALSTDPTRGGFVLNGTKMFTTNGGLADVVVVAGRLRGGVRAATGHEGITLFAVRRGADGFSTGRRLQKMGWRSSDTRELRFDYCFVAEQDVIGEPGRGFYHIMSSFQLERIVLSGMALGLAQAALTAALDYAKERVAFGSPISKYQSVRHVLGGLHAELEAARLLTYTAAARVGGTPSDGRSAVAMAKLVTARLANRVADAAVQVFGGYGYLEESPIALHYRDARILRIGGGTDEVQLEIIARELNL